jgi:lipopolysaccharide/colanic/teichoic acid biosynthesis glycosyltransferase/proline dehydrogenase
MTSAGVDQKGTLGKLSRGILATVARQSLVRKVALSTPLVRDLAWRFVAGEDLNSGIAAVHVLDGRGIKGTLNHVGTHVRDKAEAVAAADEAIGALGATHRAGLESNISIKLTQIGLDIDEHLCRSQLRRVLDAAQDVGGFVRIDMEESGYTDRTIRLFEEMRDGYGTERVGIVVQSYLRDHVDDLDRLLKAGSRIRLVKGGYWEAGDVVFRAPAEVEAAFLADIDRLIERGDHPAIATHDVRAINHALTAAARRGLDRKSYEFQMLYGVRADLQERLVRDGYQVRCYVPFGSHWYEYFLGCVRRLPGDYVRRLRRRVARHAANRVRLTAKRAIDVAGALAGLVVLSPVLALTALAVFLTQGSPILFRHERPGLGGHLFTLFKFRTMRPAHPDEVWYDSDDQRVTRLGRFLRSTSIDELPELWNVLRGEMSLVGPRPLLVEYLDRYTTEERRRHEMRPGITGWAAVNGRHAMPFEERLKLDVWYVDNWGLLLDLRILAMTVSQVLRRADVSAVQDMDEIDFPLRFLDALATEDARARRGS